MKTHFLHLIEFIIIIFFVSIAFASDFPDNSQLTVTDVSLNPEVFYEGDIGTLTVTVMNTGSVPAVLDRASLYSNSINVLQTLYRSVGIIGAQNRMSFTFPIKASTIEGIYYPIFYLYFRDSGQLIYPIKLVVSNEPLKIGILEKPDTFSNGRKDQISVSVGNPRDNTVTGVTLISECQGAEVTPTTILLGSLPPNSQVVTPFSVIPERSCLLKIKVQYQNGVNIHEQNLTIPINIGEGKKQGDPLVTNIQILPENDYYRLTGDISNAGLDDAKGVVITIGPPGIPIDPYRVYVVGSLKPDDFSSFQLTFRAQQTPEVPLLLYFKDADGNSFQTNISVATGQITSPLPNASPINFPLLLVSLFIVIGFFVAGVIYQSWKNI